MEDLEEAIYVSRRGIQTVIAPPLERVKPAVLALRLLLE